MSNASSLYRSLLGASFYGLLFWGNITPCHLFFSNKFYVHYGSRFAFIIQTIVMGAISLLALVLAAIVFSAGGIVVGKILVKRSFNAQKGQPYECGIPTHTSPWQQFHVGYYLFALLFLVFDVELIFMYPWAVVVKKTGIVALVEILVFIFILFIGFLYAHKKGALKWS